MTEHPLERKETMYHTIIIVGNLGKDPEMRYLPSGQAVCDLSVATNRQYTNASGQPIKETIWFRVSVWGKQAESVNQYLRKGSKVLVEGRLNPDQATGGPRIWTRQDGTAAASYEISANTVRFLSSRTDDQGASQAEDTTASHPSDTEEIPF
jgi:single-strand DNA-binding protein